MTKNTSTIDQNYTSITINGTPSTPSVATFGTEMVSHLKSWLDALQEANELLPSHLRFDDIDFDFADTDSGEISLELIAQLETLPVFALSIAVQEHALLGHDGSSLHSSRDRDGSSDSGNGSDKHDKRAAFATHIEEWAAQNPLWQIISVPHSADTLSDVSGSDRLTPALIYRYILMPTDAATMQPSKKSAAAHILDDGMTAHLRQFIETLPITNDMGGDAAIDCHIVSLAKMLRPHRVICLDMDSTLIEQEVIVELAKHAGVGDEVNEITESAMRGEIDFDTSFGQRMALLEGLSTDVLDKVHASLTLSAGARTLIASLKTLGYHTVLISGGFSYFAERIAKELGIDEVHANELIIENDQVTGEVSLPIINGERKAVIVDKIAKRMGISTEQVVCVGDGANDLAMMAAADLGIAYHAKPIVRARSDAAINATGLEGVLYVLGYTPKDLL